MLADPHIQTAVSRLTSGLFIVSSVYDGERSGVIVRSVQVCADEPVLLSVALHKGHSIEPLIRDSRAFAVCQLADDDRLARRVFSQDNDTDPENRTDPFDALATMTLKTGSPVLRKSPVALDCEVVRHYDLEADCELYIGLVVDARTLEAKC